MRNVTWCAFALMIAVMAFIAITYATRGPDEVEEFQRQLNREKLWLKRYRDPRCDTGARYDAMRDGVDCSEGN
jgi:hypothetical protein